MRISVVVKSLDVLLVGYLAKEGPAEVASRMLEVRGIDRQCPKRFPSWGALATGTTDALTPGWHICSMTTLRGQP